MWSESSPSSGVWRSAKKRSRWHAASVTAEALLTGLHSRHWALTGPGRARERLAHTAEMLLVAKESLKPETEFLAHDARLHCYLELCDRWGMETEIQAMTAITEQIRQPFHRWHTVCLRTLGATLDGRFADAERLAQEALELARLLQSEYTTYVSRYAQMLAIRWAQGRLPELWPEIQDHGERFPWIPRWRDALAAAELSDEEAARRELERHAVRGFAELPRDGNWIVHVCSLADACVLVGDERRACSSTSSCSPTRATTPSRTARSRSGRSPCASASSRRCSSAGRTPNGTSRLRSAAASSLRAGDPRPRAARARASAGRSRRRRRPRTDRRDVWKRSVSATNSV